MVVQTSCNVTPFSFLTIVHHGEDSQMTINSWTRGSVAGSSLAVKGTSLSRASGLNPEVEPHHRAKKFGWRLRSICKSTRLTGLEMEDEMESRVRVCEDGVELEFGLEEVEFCGG